jgi:hypothetical protein
MRRSALSLLVLAIALAIFASACGGASAREKGAVTIEPLTTDTPSAPAVGGKPAPPPSPAPADAAPATETPAADPPADTHAATVLLPVLPLASDGSTAPAEGRWIDVDVTTFTVRLMDGATVTREIAPVAVGAQVDTGEYASTQTGLFYVYDKVEGLAYDPPYDTYISHWIGFDPDKANGFHSLLKDKDGHVVDASTGRVSNGCIRSAAPDAIFAFADIGMPVWVHH